jgi:uncharacterized protein (TIGR00290 family)
MKRKIILSWSGGKDSALALQAIQQSNKYDVVALITTITEDYDRVSIHGVRRNIIEAQSKNIGIPVTFISINANATNEEYEEKFCKAVIDYKKSDVEAVAYGDIFLEDLKMHREQMLKQIGIQAIFPLWKRNTKHLARKFIQNGFRGKISCVDTDAMHAKFSGSEFNTDFLAELHKDIDPCGEYGEFHSCVYAGPIFKKNLSVQVQSTLQRNQFVFADIVLV